MAGRKGRSGGHNAKTTQQHIEDGTYQKCRHEDRADNQPADGEPIKPTSLSDDQSKVWDEVVGYLPAESLGVADTVVLREMCRIYSLYDKAMQLWESAPIDKDARLAATAAWDRFWRIVQDFGGTPISRTRLEMSPPGDEEGAETGSAGHDFLVQFRDQGKKPA